LSHFLRLQKEQFNTFRALFFVTEGTEAADAPRRSSSLAPTADAILLHTPSSMRHAGAQEAPRGIAYSLHAERFRARGANFLKDVCNI